MAQATKGLYNLCRVSKVPNSPSGHILGVAALSSGVIEHLLPSTVSQTGAAFKNREYTKWIVVVNFFIPVIRHVK